MAAVDLHRALSFFDRVSIAWKAIARPNSTSTQLADTGTLARRRCPSRSIFCGITEACRLLVEVVNRFRQL